MGLSVMQREVSECTTSTFITLLEVQRKHAMIEWCMKVGLIATCFVCPKCGDHMHLCERKGSKEGFEWRCRKQGPMNVHGVCRSIKKGSWFSHLSLCDILIITRCCFLKMGNESLMQEVKVHEHSAVDWFMFCREVCMMTVYLYSSSEIYRLNLEQGRFLNPYQTNASSINKIVVHPGYDLIACGTVEGKVEAWDPRMRQRVGILDCALSCMADNTFVEGFPSVTALSFKDGLTLGVGTFTGQILLYDVRTNKPFMVKDHMYGLPIKNVEFIKSEELVASLDPKCVKFWKQKTGKPYTTIQAPAHLNDLCFVPETGLLFLANEDKKILTYFIPSIGPAPQWCCFLDNITEELEESKQDAVYDDYKFVTKKELEELHLDHLQGTSLLRAYMHGYFMDIRLYNKARAIIQPMAYKDLKKKMVHNKIELERKNQVVVEELPNVNREYAQKLLEKKVNEKLQVPTPFEDERFKDLFKNPDFKINETDEEYARIKSTVEKTNKKKVNIISMSDQMKTLEEEETNKADYTSSEEEDESEDDEDEGEDESESEDSLDESSVPSKKKEKIFEAVDSERFSMLHNDKEEEDSLVPIAERLKKENSSFKQCESFSGNKVVTFTVKEKEEKQSKMEQERKAHMKDRAKYRRPAKYLRK
ncbi:LOW QUALITY PROTEIN: nucleolar protein 10-like [Stegodyphus dumicola]|uniref:LOW QUALITY PROTEIN: nucleolar protein 10-like n=1 Tax=Stegodyphus dumicola TaxID=202533 RepID=UPI0015ACB823|nr:LOW QUALITY PROTEIN: nucleolar protein 10-like [Stegodyphus dumicola]